MSWWAVVKFVAVLALNYFLTPKTQIHKPAPADNVEVPVAEVGGSIPVLFGTRDLKGPNVVWYGDMKVEPIRKSGGKK